MSSFSLDGQRLSYTEYGEGPRLTVLLHGLLFSQRMHETLARALAERGDRVITLDLLGHGESDRPRDKWRYIVLDWLRQDPEPSSAVFQGLFFGRTAPPRELRRAIAAPTLVIGHQHDIIHPFSDAGMLVDELPEGRLLEAHSVIELRLAPERLTNEIAAFLDDCWKPKAASKRSRAS